MLKQRWKKQQQDNKKNSVSFPKCLEQMRMNTYINALSAHWGRGSKLTVQALLSERSFPDTSIHPSIEALLHPGPAAGRSQCQLADRVRARLAHRASRRPRQLEPDLPSNPNTGRVCGHHTLDRGEVRPPVCKGRLSGHPLRCESITETEERKSEKNGLMLSGALSDGNNQRSSVADRISAWLSWTVTVHKHLITSHKLSKQHSHKHKL